MAPEVAAVERTGGYDQKVILITVDINIKLCNLIMM